MSEWNAVFWCKRCEHRQIIINTARSAEGMKDACLDIYGDKCDRCGEKWSEIEVTPA
jgi:predicted RNA-binding protein with PUA domain